MSKRKKYLERCARCFMKEDLCICTLIPVISLTTKLIVIVGKREASVPTNTGRLATLALKNSVTLIRGDTERPYSLAEHLPYDHHHLLLYPSAEAPVLTTAYMSQFSRPCTLVVPDGNWRQANKMRKRDEVMGSLQVVKVAPGIPSEYKVRKENHIDGLATIEAIARALGVIEGPEVQRELEELLNVMVNRTLLSRGIRHILEDSQGG
ncbi:MAG: DTW domain-containing protein [Proteobacteria bacterium]|nr:DTW domain-containing protein [Pseudomonadota bacterium]